MSTLCQYRGICRKEPKPNGHKNRLKQNIVWYIFSISNIAHLTAVPAYENFFLPKEFGDPKRSLGGRLVTALSW